MKRARTRSADNVKDGSVVANGTCVSVGAAPTDHVKEEALGSAGGCAGASAAAAKPKAEPKAEPKPKPKPKPKAEPVVDDTVWITPDLAAPLCRVEINSDPSRNELYYTNKRPDLVRKDTAIIKSLYMVPEEHLGGPSACIDGVSVVVTRVSDVRTLVTARDPFFVQVLDSTIYILPIRASYSRLKPPVWISTALTVVGPPGRVRWTFMTCSNGTSAGTGDASNPATLVAIASECLAQSVIINTDTASVKITGDAALSLCSVKAKGACSVKMGRLVSGTLLLHLDSAAEFVCTNGKIDHAVANLSYGSRAELPRIVTSIHASIEHTSTLITNSVPPLTMYRSPTETRRVRVNARTGGFEFLEE
jgi:hypothetical protein